MKTLLDLISELRGLYEKYGNLQVIKKDGDWGLDANFIPKVKKVWQEHDYLVSFNDDIISERRVTACTTYSEELIREAYDRLMQNLRSAGFPENESFEDFRANMLRVAPDAAETVRKYDEAPFMVIV